MSMDAPFNGQTTSKDIKRNEKKGERGVCRIQKCIEGHGYATVGSGSLIKHVIDSQWRSEYFVVTTKEVFQGDFDIKNYSVDFLKSRSKLKKIPLFGAVVRNNILQNSSGLTVIPLDPDSSHFCHGRYRKKKCGILKHHAFEVELNDEETRTGEFTKDLCLYMVSEPSPTSTSFDVTFCQLDSLPRGSTGQYDVHKSPEYRGAPILRRVHKKWSVVGVFSSTTESSQPIWFSKENLDPSKFLPAITQADSEVHTDASTRASPQQPPNNSNGTPNRSNELSDLSRNGHHVDTEEESLKKEDEDRMRKEEQDRKKKEEEMKKKEEQDGKKEQEERNRKELQDKKKEEEYWKRKEDQDRKKGEEDRERIEEQDRKKKEEDRKTKEEQDRKKEEEDRKRKEVQDRKKVEEDRKRKEEQDRKKEEEERKEEQKDRKNEQNIDGPPAAGLKSSDETKLNITLASDNEGWNKTVNGQLVIELGRCTRLKVTGFVPKNNYQQREHARSLNIELVDAKDHAAFSSSELLSFPPDSLEIDILLIHAHGQDLGRQAQIIKEVKKCMWVQVVHTLEELCEGQQRLQTLCEKADFIIAVGPKVADACKRALRYSQKHVFDLTPGVFEELSGVRQFYGDLREFHVLLSGSSEYFSLKGCDIAAKTIKLLNTPSASYHLTVMVKPDNNEEEVKEALLHEGIDPYRLTVRVSDHHDDWCTMLHKADLAIKPSRNEGFGMSGLLAISANLPVLVSEFSGLGIVLKNIPLGNSSVVASDDPKVWANRIKEVRAKTSEIRHAEAVQLREAYMQRFNWKDQCGKLVEELFRIVPQKSVGPDVTTMCSAQTLNSEENIQIRMQNATSETKQKMAGDVVDAGVNQIASRVNARLSTSVKGIPLNVYGPLCLMLNVKRDVKYDDFRMLAEKVGLNRDETYFIEQLKNPTDEILNTWSKKNEATVGTLIDLLKGEHLERMDAVKLLEGWVNKKKHE